MLELEPSPTQFLFFLPPGELFHISNQSFKLGMEEESSDEMKLAGHVEPLATILGVRFASNHAGGNIPTYVYHVNGIFQA